MLGTLARNPFPQYQVLAFRFELKSHSSRTVFADAHRPPTIPALWDMLFQSPLLLPRACLRRASGYLLKVPLPARPGAPEGR